MAKDYYLYVKGKAVPVSEEEKQKLEEEKQKLEEEERKINEIKDRIHQNYLKRKANGKQQEYEERYKARREQKKQDKLRVLKRVGILVKGSDDNL